MTRPAATLALLLAVAGCSATGPPRVPQTRGWAAEVPPLPQLLPAGTIALLHAAIIEPASGVRMLRGAWLERP